MGMITTFVFWLIIILGIIMFLKFDRRISLLNRLFFSIIGVLILLFLFIFISALIVVILVVILIVLVYAFFSRRGFYRKRGRRR